MSRLNNLGINHSAKCHTYISHADTYAFSSPSSGNYYPLQSTLDAPPLVVPDFTISSLSSSLAHITANGTITDVCTYTIYNLEPSYYHHTLLLQVVFRGHSSSVQGLASHPSLPRIAITGYSTLLQLWDYQNKWVDTPSLSHWHKAYTCAVYTMYEGRSPLCCLGRCLSVENSRSPISSSVCPLTPKESS